MVGKKPHEPKRTDTYIILDEADLQDPEMAGEETLREALDQARQEVESGVITQEQFNRIEKRVHALLIKCGILVGDIERYIEKKRREYDEQAAEEERLKREEEERLRREEEERKAEEERQRREEEERQRREEEERKRRELEELMREPELNWRNVETITAFTRTISLDRGAFQVKKLYEEALDHGDWASVARRMLERYRQSPMDFTFTQIKKSTLLKEMDNIFPPEEINPVVVPAIMIAKENPLSDDQVFFIINAESQTKYRYTPASVVKMSDVMSVPFTPKQ